MASVPPPYQGHRYPVETLAHCVRRSFRFPLGLRKVEELMPERGAVVSRATIRRRCAKSGQACTNALRRRRPARKDFRSVCGVQRFLSAFSASRPTSDSAAG